MAAVPGVTAVSAINHLPLAGDAWRFRIQPEGRPEPRPGEEASATWRLVRTGYFSTMRLALRGRDFDTRDRAEGLPVCIVNETMARRHWPGQDPIGRRVGVGTSERRWLTVVGVSADARQSEWTGSVPEEIYAPYAQHATEFGSAELTFVVRTAGDPAGACDRRAARCLVGRLECANLGDRHDGSRDRGPSVALARDRLPPGRSSRWWRWCSRRSASTA